MDKTIIAIKGLSFDNKKKYVYENSETNGFVFIDVKEEATKYISCEVFEAEEKLRKQFMEHGYNVEKLEFERIKVKG